MTTAAQQINSVHVMVHIGTRFSGWNLLLVGNVLSSLKALDKLFEVNF